MNRLPEHPLWPTLKKFIFAEDCEGNTRFRLEMKTLPEDIAAAAVAMRVECAHCNAEMSPIRSRKAPKNRRSTKIGHGLYIAVTCPTGPGIGCSKGTSASAEYDRIRALL